MNMMMGEMGSGGPGGGMKNNKKKKGSTKRWDKNGEVAKYLEKALLSGDIDPNETPKSVYDRYPMFQVFKLENFRTQFNKLKGDLGLNARRETSAVASIDILDDDDDDGKYLRYLFCLLSTCLTLFLLFLHR